MNKNVLICIPSFDQKIHLQTISSIISVRDTLNQAKIGCGMMWLRDSLITRARNTLVQLFMDDPGNYTHLLFIDADIGFSEKSVFRMLDLDEEVVAGIYPRKAIDWRKVKKRITNNPDIDIEELHAASLEYNINVKTPDRIEVKKGFIEVLDGATGFMLIKRQVFEKMAKSYPEDNRLRFFI